MQEWKMTDKNYGVWKMQDWKMTDKLLQTVSTITGMSSHLHVQLSVFSHIRRNRSITYVGNYH